MHWLPEVSSGEQCSAAVGSTLMSGLSAPALKPLKQKCHIRLNSMPSCSTSRDSAAEIMTVRWQLEGDFGCEVMIVSGHES